MNYVKFNGTKNEVPFVNPSPLQRYASYIQDQNYFDPILFGYFFTANGIPIGSTLTIAENIAPTQEEPLWNNYSLYAPPNILALGKFEITFYTKFI